MRLSHITEMTRGWFVGDFEPSALRTSAVEVALHHCSEGDSTWRHFHNVATEVNLLLTGQMYVNGVHLGPGDIFVFDPGEVSEAEFVTDCTLVVVKVPSVRGDKYYV